MPAYKFIITIIGGTWNGHTEIRFSEADKDSFVYFIKDTYNLDCKVEKVKLDF